MTKIRISIIIILAMFLAVGALFLYSYYNKGNHTKFDVKTSDLRPIDANSISSNRIIFSSEIGLTDEQLIDNSDIIVRGKITKALGEYDYKFDNNGETVSIEKINYDFDLSEVLKGEGIDKITISCTGNLAVYDIALDKECVYCLDHDDGDLKNAYSFVSPMQGVFEVSSDELILHGKKMKIDYFKKEIKDVLEKNKKGIKIESPIKDFDGE